MAEGAVSAGRHSQHATGAGGPRSSREAPRFGRDPGKRPHHQDPGCPETCPLATGVPPAWQSRLGPAVGRVQLGPDLIRGRGQGREGAQTEERGFEMGEGTPALAPSPTAITAPRALGCTSVLRPAWL